MKRGYALVEGQTEEAFVKRVLGPFLETRKLFLKPIIVETKRLAAGKKFRGGGLSFATFKPQVLNLLGDGSAVVVTTMLDLYALPDDFPCVDRPKTQGRRSAQQKASDWENTLQSAFDDRRFLPYFSLHEFEALLFVSPREIARAFSQQEPPRALVEALETAGPEDLNDGPETHPSARLEAALPTYRKTLHGPLIVERIGLDALRARCPHFDSWVSRLEAIAGG